MDTQHPPAALTMMENYGNYAVANPFDANEDYLPHTSTHNASTPRVRARASDDMSSKKHAACDECRKRKLKCSGEPAGCERCIKNTLTCLYSEQKQMGRPKKRQRLDSQDYHTTAAASQPIDASARARARASASFIDPNLSADDRARTDFENVCGGPVAQSIRRSTHASLSNTPPSEHPRTPSDNSDLQNPIYPLDYAMWPDFSDTTLPMPMVVSAEKDFPLPDADFNPDSMSSLPTVPECPCLPNMYLTLSTLSTLSAFPVSSHTISTLDNAHRTARAVIYCAVCPQKFQSGSQNVMLASTLITVLVDQWKRISKASAIDIRKGFCPNPPPPGPPSDMNSREDLEWRTFAYDLMRHFVFGDRPLPSLPYQPPDRGYSYLPSVLNQRQTLISLANAMERRQRVWHDLEPDTGEFPKKMTRALEEAHTGFTLADIREMENAHTHDNGHLCIQLVKHAKRCINSLDREVPRLAHCHSGAT